MITHSRTLRTIWSLCFAIGLSLPALAQAPVSPGLTFEVASVKKAVPLNPQAILQSGMIPRIGMTVAGNRVEIGLMSLAELIPIAYEVKPFQVDGPDWLSSERFDIQAVMPAGAGKEQVPEMLRGLLAERFQLKVHRENRDHSVYGLVVGKSGHKLKEAEPDPVESLPNDGNTLNIGNGTQVRLEGAAAGGGRGNPFGGGNIATITSPEGGAARMSMTPDGQMQMNFTKMSMAQFADTLTRLVDKPVLDMTELKGNYQASVTLQLTDLLSIARNTGLAGGLLGGGAPLPPGVGARGAAGAAVPQASDPSGNSIFASVQQLGLQLENRKAPVEFIVVDQAEKTPTEN